ncbi:hypothetical protein WA026_019401 [Henosepilachna vigintioctopunctata]|uniref:Uncharacterized protein n=1 Tax=Henosepilachna vigintioctopunctata TaxID=420089 RepID=A0AAW1U1M6_9CUCU
MLSNMDNYGTYLASFQDMMMQHRQVQPNSLSPPYSNQYPPHSVQSNMSLLPQGYNGSPSTAKARPSLPTIPTYIAAMRAATQQKHGGVPQTQNLQIGFDFLQTALDLPMPYTTDLQLIYCFNILFQWHYMPPDWVNYRSSPWEKT